MRRARFLAVLLVLGVSLGLLVLHRSARERGPSPPGPGAEAKNVVALAPPRMSPTILRREGDRDAGPVLDEHSRVERIRALVKIDPRLAESLAREARQQLRDSPESDDRDMLLVLALINQNRTAVAIVETYYYFEHHPGGRHVDQLSAMIGVKPER
jgi:hypothetical protein